MSVPYGIIYSARNTCNGKVYVGQTIQSLEMRWAQHRCFSKNRCVSRLHNAIKKYGADAFELSILGEASGQAELDRLEAFFIEKLQTIKGGYNITAGGGGVKGFVPDEVIRAKVSEASKRFWSVPENKQRMKQMISRRVANPNYRAAQRLRSQEICARPDVVEAHRRNSLAMWQDEDFRAKESVRRKAVMQRPERRLLVSCQAKQRWNDPGFKARMSELRKQLWRDPEFRDRQVASRKKRTRDLLGRWR